jgi:metal-responsive CopG/Arc/MetJ family transcriptional regulator
MNSKNVTYTSTLPKTVMEEVVKYAHRHNKKKNEVITEAITTFLKEKRKQEYAETFKKMENDPEQKFLAEAGLGDFLE